MSLRKGNMRIWGWSMKDLGGLPHCVTRSLMHAPQSDKLPWNAGSWPAAQAFAYVTKWNDDPSPYKYFLVENDDVPTEPPR